MSRRGENIFKRKDNRWEARILVKDLSGQKKYHSLYGKSYKEAKEKKENYLKNNADEKPASYVSFQDVLQLWLENRYFYQKKSTQFKYKNIIEKHIIPELGKMDINMLDDVIINHFLNKKKESGRIDGKGGLSNSYVRTMAIIISSARSYAVSKKLCTPLSSKIQKPPIEKKKIQVLSESTQDILEKKLLCCESYTAIGILVALNTGLRIGEICALKWEDIDLSEKIIHVRHSVIRIANSDNYDLSASKLIISSPKTKSSIRDIPINRKLFDILLNYYSEDNFGYIISDSNTFVKPRTFEYHFHKILADFEMQDINFHTLRHTFATRCVEKNVDIKTLSEILGHGNVSITLNTYVHTSMEAKRTQLEKLCD